MEGKGRCEDGFFWRFLWEGVDREVKLCCELCWMEGRLRLWWLCCDGLGMGDDDGFCGEDNG